MLWDLKNKIYNGCLNLGRKEDLPLFYPFAFCMLVTFSGLSTT